MWDGLHGNWTYANQEEVEIPVPALRNDPDFDEIDWKQRIGYDHDYREEKEPGGIEEEDNEKDRDEGGEKVGGGET